MLGVGVFFSRARGREIVALIALWFGTLVLADGVLAQSLAQAPADLPPLQQAPADLPPLQSEVDTAAVATRAHTDVAGAIRDSTNLLFLEHGWRVLFQEKTRRELRGPFFQDYVQSVRWPGQWGDTDSWQMNYIGHPIHGAAAGMIWLDHGPDGTVGTNLDRQVYWNSRLRATAFSALYSLQFEVGPFSEASIGNVGMRPETTGWSDYVVTPAGALVILVAEDAIDRFLVEWIERRTSNRAVRATLRMVFNPSRALANASQAKFPWYRPNRTLSWK